LTLGVGCGCVWACGELPEVWLGDGVGEPWAVGGRRAAAWDPAVVLSARASEGTKTHAAAPTAATRATPEKISIL
jgi:hypothetical protein